MDDIAEKDALLTALLPHVPFDGWSMPALRTAAAQCGLSDPRLAELFPRGPRDAVAWFSDWADRQTLAALAQTDLAALRVHRRIKRAVETRLAVLAPHREALRSALSLLAFPTNLGLASTLLYRTVDALWYAAGDTATDFNFYTKRGLLAGVYAATTFYWLDDRSPDYADTLGFLDRRLADVGRIPQLRKRMTTVFERMPSPARLRRAVEQGSGRA